MTMSPGSASASCRRPASGEPEKFTSSAILYTTIGRTRHPAVRTDTPLGWLAPRESCSSARVRRRLRPAATRCAPTTSRGRSGPRRGEDRVLRTGRTHPPSTASDSALCRAAACPLSPRTSPPRTRGCRRRSACSSTGACTPPCGPSSSRSGPTCCISCSRGWLPTRTAAPPGVHVHLDFVDALSLNMASRAAGSRFPASAAFGLEARLMARYEAAPPARRPPRRSYPSATGWPRRGWRPPS